MLRQFWLVHADAEPRLRAWYRVVSAARWETWAELQAAFPSADRVGRLVVFNVGGNTYRLIARVDFDTHQVFIRHVLTHAEYSTNAWKQDPWF